MDFPPFPQITVERFDRAVVRLKFGRRERKEGIKLIEIPVWTDVFLNPFLLTSTMNCYGIGSLLSNSGYGDDKGLFSTSTKSTFDKRSRHMHEKRQLQNKMGYLQACNGELENRMMLLESEIDRLPTALNAQQRGNSSPSQAWTEQKRNECEETIRMLTSQLDACMAVQEAHRSGRNGIENASYLGESGRTPLNRVRYIQQYHPVDEINQLEQQRVTVLPRNRQPMPLLHGGEMKACYSEEI